MNLKISFGYIVKTLALNYMKKIDKTFNYFWHQNDKFTLTSKVYLDLSLINTQAIQ